MKIVLGIESSCDETAVALVREDGVILSQALATQQAEHAPFGGVVPEIAARAHLAQIDRLYTQAMREAKLELSQVDAVAVTTGPGLIGGVIVGVMFGKALAAANDAQLLYRTPQAASIDNNTVALDVERAKFADNALHYEANLTFLNGQIKALLSAIQG